MKESVPPDNEDQHVMSRQDASGRARAGSQRHIQTHINDEVLCAKLDGRLEAALPGLESGKLEWRAPLVSA